MAAAVFLGGPLGPVLPGPVWLWLKTAAVMALTVLLGHVVARTTPRRMLTLLWIVALPLSFLHLAHRGGAGAVTDALIVDPASSSPSGPAGACSASTPWSGPPSR